MLSLRTLIRWTVLFLLGMTGISSKSGVLQRLQPALWFATTTGDNQDSNSSSSVLTRRGGSSSSNATEQDATNSSLTRRRLEFLDRIALVSSSLLKREDEAELKEDHQEHDPQSITEQSDLTRPARHIHIVTTATLPWFTGTAVNPLLRAAHLHRRTQAINNGQGRWVTLVVPWLELEEDQQELYGKVFANEAEQEQFVRQWLREDAAMPDAADQETGLEILFYPARFHAGLGSIFAMGDIMTIMNETKMDVCVLEEPEHCNWFRAPGDGWTKRFNYVIGIVHTNYKEYASAHYSGLWTAPAIAMMSSAMVRAYCHKVIRLSAVLQTYAPEKEVTSNVHGVRGDFLEEGKRRREFLLSGQAEESVEEGPDVYFIAKLLWAKGLDLLLDLEDYYKQCTGDYFEIDIFGNGPDQKDIMRAFHGRRNVKLEEDILKTTLAIGGGSEEDAVSSDEDSCEEPTNSLHRKAKAKLAKFKQKIDAVELPKSFYELRRQPIPANFPGRVDHATVKRHKVFVNPSISEVLCTTTAEALAMGKFAIIPVHPSNTFFLKFPNCLAYRNKFEFVANLRWAMTHDPEPLTDELMREFTWEAATDRFIEASAITWEEAHQREKLGKSKLDERIAWLHNEIGKGATGDMLRKIFGAGPAAHQVKYTTEQLQEDSEEDEEDGLSSKFRSSSLAEAIRATVGDLSSFIQ